MKYDRNKSRVFLPKVDFPIPSPEEDFGTYERLSESLSGVLDLLREYMSNEGRVGHATLKAVMNLTKAAVAHEVRGRDSDKERADEYRSEARRIMEEFQMLSLPDELAALCADGRAHPLAGHGRDRFSDMMYQEIVEMELFAKLWPVVLGDVDEVPKLPTIYEFSAPLQAVLAGYVDVVSELSKAVDTVSERETDEETEMRLQLYDRYLRIARSVRLKLSEFSGFTPAVLNNSFGRFNGFKDKFHRQVDGSIAHKTRAREEKLDAARGRKELLRALALEKE